MHVVLVHPEIHWNTGNAGRTCLAIGATLHLIEPLGFPLDDAKMRRAGLDYHDYATMKVHKNWDAFLLEAQPDPSRMFALTTHGSSPFADAAFQPGDVFVFGAESRGLDPALDVGGAVHLVLLDLDDDVAGLDALVGGGSAVGDVGDQHAGRTGQACGRRHGALGQGGPGFRREGGLIQPNLC